MNLQLRRAGAALMAFLTAAQPFTALAASYEHKVAIRSLVVTPAPTNPGGGTTPPPAPTPSPRATLSATSISNLSVEVGASDTRTLVLSNDGTAALTVQFSDTMSPLSVAHDCPGSLTPGQSCNINVTWAPQQAGPWSGSFSIITNTPSSPLVVAVSGSAYATLSASLHSDLDNYSNALSGAFGTVDLKSTRELPVYVRAAGASGTLATTAYLSGANASEFRIVQARKYAETYIGGMGWTLYDAKSCGAVIAADGLSTSTCTSDPLGDAYAKLRHAYYTIRFEPKTAGVKTATLMVAHNGSNESPMALTLTATAVALPAVTLNRTAIAFGSQDIGATVPAETVRFTNDGTASLVLSAAPTVEGSTEFSAAHNCPIGGAGLAPGEFCDVNVTYAPASQATVSATLRFASNAAGSPHSVTLSGTGLRGYGTLDAASGSSSNFGNIELGTSNTAVLTFTNTGNKAVTGVYATTAGSTQVALDAGLSNTCGLPGTPGTVAPGATCTVTARFTPTTLGSLTGVSVSVISSAVNSPVSISLSGRGVTPGTASTLLDINDESGSVVDANGVAISNPGGNVTVTSATSAVGSRSLNFPAYNNTTYLSTASSTTNYIGTRAFTIEAWVRPTSATTNYTVISNYPAKNWDATSWTLDISDYNNGKVGFWSSGFSSNGPMLSSTTVLTANQWAHLAVTRSGNTWRLFVNGKLEATATHSAAVDGPSQAAQVLSAGFRGSGAGAGYQGQMDGVRVISGYALYTADFTPSGSSRLEASTPSTTAAGTALVGGTLTHVVTVTNNGGLSSGTVATNFTGANASEWSIASTTCGASLAAGASCAYTLRLTPLAAGSKTATFTVSATNGGTATFSLTGTAVTSTTISSFGTYYAYTNGTYAASCYAYYQAGGAWNGVYRVDADGAGTLPAVDVYCDQASDGGGWTMVLGGSNSVAVSGWNSTGAVGSSTQGATPSSPFKLADAVINALRTSVSSAPTSARYRFVALPTAYPNIYVRYVGNSPYNHTACWGGGNVTSYSNSALNTGGLSGGGSYSNTCGFTDYSWTGVNNGYFITNAGPGAGLQVGAGSSAWSINGSLYMYVR